MLLTSFVALDLETTGSDPSVDQIIEVAAVRFEEGRETAVFSQLVNPGFPVPIRIRNLTGIHDGMLAGKPGILEVYPQLAEFIGNLPVVAHNAGFDVAFLRAAAVRCGGRFATAHYDTVDLARIALPLAKNHRLATLARHLQLVHEQAHRAEDDARATGQLFAALIRRLEQLELGMLSAILQMGEPVGWGLAPLVRALVDQRMAGGETIKPVTQWIRPAEGPLHRSEEAGEPVEPEPLDAGRLMEILSPGGLVAEAFPTYEHRPQQLRMVSEVAQALSGGQHLLMEAGTGTGKSLAYLLPAFAWAKQTGEKVVISTHTINLQEQLWEKDIPFLQKALQGSELDGVTAALVKGRSNYLCLRKWEEEATGAGFLASPEEREFHIRVASWVSQTETGDKSELNLAGDGERGWLGVMSETETCLGPKCKWYKNHCFAFRARRRARDADILIVNHSLLFSDLRSENQVLPPFRHLIIDEAHHVEGVATQNLGINLEHLDLVQALNHLFRGFRAEVGPGMLPQLKRRLNQPLPARPPLGLPHEDHLDKLIDAVFAARGKVDELFRLLHDLVQRHGAGEEEPSALAGSPAESVGGRSLRLTPEIRIGPFWEALDAARANAVHRLLMLAQGLTALCDLLEDMERPPKDLDSILVEVQKQRGLLGEAATDINAVLLDPPDGTVTWIEVGGRRESPRVTLRSAPINVGPLLQEKLWQKARSVTMTSATLSVGGGFEHLKQRLGLSGLSRDRLREGLVESPFSYKQQALLCVPDDMPAPNDRQYTAAVEAFLREFLVAAQGRTLVLFTSHRQLKQIALSLRPELETEGLVLLAQGVDGARGRLVEEFKESKRAVLFGSASFWEGVDIPGEGLSCVILVRLPFSPPDDPVMQARIEDLERRGYSSFRSLSLPQAVIRFKQGFGRLIRAASDRGVVVVLDNRVLRSRTAYGATFVKSLPGPQTYSGPARQVIDRAVDWLNMEYDG